MPVKKQRRRDQILDVAEKLFARHGFDGVTLRQVAQESGVDLALASYHYGNKRGLFDAVFSRRAQIMNEFRMAALDAVQEAAGPEGPTIEALLDSALEPVLNEHLEEDEGWRHYLELVAYVNNSTQWGQEMMTRDFEPLLQRYLEAFKVALPNADEADIYWCYHFFSGALTLTFAQTGRIDTYSKGICDSRDLVGAYRRMVPFMVAGFKELAKSGPLADSQ